nr:unnamed protein product [Spirometra erinaceieuropaei]
MVDTLDDGVWVELGMVDAQDLLSVVELTVMDVLGGGCLCSIQQRRQNDHLVRLQFVAEVEVVAVPDGLAGFGDPADHSVVYLARAEEGAAQSEALITLESHGVSGQSSGLCHFIFSSSGKITSKFSLNMLDCLNNRSSALPRTSSRILSKRRCDPAPLRTTASINSSWSQECPKAIIRNRLILDRILREVSLLPTQSPPPPDVPCRGFGLLTTDRSRDPEPEGENSDDDGRKLCANLALPFPISCKSTVATSSRATTSTRCLRSGGPAAPSLSKPSSSSQAPEPSAQPSKPDGSHVKLLLTVPHTFVGQRVSQENRTEYLVKWQGDLCSGVAPVMWVKDEEVRVAARLDRL